MSIEKNIPPNVKVVSGNNFAFDAAMGLFGGVAGVADKIGSATLWAGKNIGYPVASSLAQGIGTGILGASKVVGQAAISSLPLIFNGAKDLYEKYPLVERSKRELVFNKKTSSFEHRGGNLQFTKTGKALFGGTALISSAFQAYDNYIIRHMGVVDTAKRTATPDFRPQEYKIQSPDFAGATGDLVFALHANR